MPGALKKYIVDVAKKINPHIKITLKYPTWHESYQRNGYNTLKSPHIFDEIYSGTETRNPDCTFFRNPRYTSYSLMRHISSYEPYNNRGNWIDPWGKPNVDVVDMLEQTYVSLFGGPREFTLWHWGELVNTLYIAAIGFELDRIDKFLDKTGSPAGIPVYFPNDAQGEDHIYDFWGTAGLPVEPTVKFPDRGTVILYAASAHDPDLVAKIKSHLIKGENVFITTGLLEKLQNKDLDEFTGLKVNNYSQSSQDFLLPGNWLSPACSLKASKEIRMRVVDIRLNESAVEIAQTLPALPNPLLAYSKYAKGRLYVINTPENWSDLYELPEPVLDKLREVVSKDVPVRLLGPAKVSLFLRDNRSCIIESFLDYGCAVHLVIKGDYKKIKNLETGTEIERENYDGKESSFVTSVNKSNFAVFGW
jgi:hypothetical protein